MKKGLIELVAIIDKSGSMGGLEDDVIGGYNSLIKEQSKLEGDVVVTTLLFDNELLYVHKGANIKDIKPMTNKDYVPSGCTALLDAIGSAISTIKIKHMSLDEKDKPEHVIFSIMTDGYENSSKEYGYKQIKNMIESQKKEGWDFLFQAANIDSLAEGGKLGISKEDIDSFVANTEGVKLCLMRTCDKIGQKRCK